MANQQRIQTDFSWGEISPALLARVDIAQYSKATKTMKNAYPMLTGGCTRRPGTTYLGELYNSNQKARLIPYVYDQNNSFLLIFNGGKIEFLKNGAFITSGASNYQLNHPYTEAELPEVNYAQAGNTIFFTHPNHKPQKLQRITDLSWTLTDAQFNCYALTDYWYENFALTFKILAGATAFTVGSYYTITIAGGVVTGTTFTGTGTGVIAQVAATPFAVNEVWTVTCIYSDSTLQKWTVTGSVSGTVVATWRTGSYPAAVAFAEQRLWFGGSPEYPQSLWASSIRSIYDFSLGANDADAMALTIASNNFDRIKHIVVARGLLPLTFAGEFSVTGGTNGAITPSSIRIQPQTFHGTSSVRPIRVAQEVLFVQRDGKKLRAISYSMAEDANVAPEISLFADHITGTGINDMCFAQDPHFIAWMTRTDGTLISLTLARDYDTIGWAQHETDGKFENVASIPNANLDEVYLISKRTINGVTKRFIERLDYNSTWTDASSSTTLGVGVKSTTWSGLGYLEGKTVDVVADGVVHPPVVVTGGAITLQTAVNSIKVGLHYDTVIELLHPEFSSDPSQTIAGRKISIYEAIFRFKDTMNCKINGFNVPFRRTTNLLDTAVEPFTGDKTVATAGWRAPNNLKIEQITPQPFTLLGVIMKVAVND